MSNEREELIGGARKAFRAGFAAVLKIEPDGLQAFYVDGRNDEARVLDAPPADDPGFKADAVWRAAPEILSEVFERARALDTSFVSGRLQVAGDMSVMARLQLEAQR